MQRALVLDKNKKPLMPCRMARARILLKKRRAAVYRLQPFTILLRDREGGSTQETELKLDPGSKTTGVALVAHFEKGGPTVTWAGDLYHRGQIIKSSLDKRRALRRSRRSRKTRYRPSRFDNRTRPEGWLPPSLQSRVGNVVHWTGRLMHLAPVSAIALEVVRFDLQKIETPEISGVEYQRGTLFGYELREYLLEKWGRKCAYCGGKDVPLEVEHLIPGSRGGTDRVSNLALACVPCNQKKGNQTAAEFGFPQLMDQAKAPLKDATAVNATRWEIGRRLKEPGLPVSFWSGGRTKYNRISRGYPRAHWVDAACVGITGEKVSLDPQQPILQLKALGRGNRQYCRMDRFGFPRTGPKTLKRFLGYQTGDLVKVSIPKGKYHGIHQGRLAGVRATGIVDVKTNHQKISISACHLQPLQKFDGWGYEASGR